MGRIQETNVGNFVAWVYIPRVRAAFKEWAVVVDALGRGEQVIILRKGGIAEDRGEFELEQERFFLFPTRFHQQRESVLPAAQRRFDEMGLPRTDNLVLEFFAEVREWRRLESLVEAQRLRGLHIWRDEIIAQRVDWGRERSIFALVVRVFCLPGRVELPMESSYGGCKSWVDLETDVSTQGSQPVLADEAFKKKLQDFRVALGADERLETY